MKTIYLKAFIIGSSFPVIFWPLCYLGVFKYIYPESSFIYSLVPITLPFIFGGMNVLQLAIAGRFKKIKTTTRYWIVGTLYGLGLSLYGNFAKNIPVELFQFPDTAIQYTIIPLAMILYGLVWRYIVKNLNHLFEIE